jgi:hypothetical protein
MIVIRDSDGPAFGKYDNETWIQTTNNTGLSDAAGADWHLVSTTVSGNTVNVYIDTIRVNTLDETVTGSPTTDRVEIGGLSYTGFERGLGATARMNDMSVWDHVLSAGQVAALHNVGKDATLNYDALDADSLFSIWSGAVGDSVTVDGLTWHVQAGTGAPGSLVWNGDVATLYTDTGSLVTVPEPYTLGLLASGLLSFLACAGRKRRRCPSGSIQA